MASDYKIFWTDGAINNLESILDYLQNRWTQREVDQFRKLLSKQIDLIQKKPFLFPLSDVNKRLRKAVLSKQTIIFYELSGQIIYIVYLFNSTQNTNRIK